MIFHSFGTQVGVTMVYTYATDSYKPQSGEIGAIINLFKSGELVLQSEEQHANSRQSSASRSASMHCRSVRKSDTLQRSRCLVQSI